MANSKRTFVVVQYDNRPLEDVDKKLMNRNKHYCQKWGYDYRFLSSGYEDIPPFWAKVKIVKEILEKEPVRGVFWLDTDATVFDFSISLDSFLEPGKAFYKATDPGGNQIFNAGVWMVLNTAEGRKIMKEWMGHYHPELWEQREDGSWDTDGAWAGNVYEQGSFAHKVVPVFDTTIETVKQPFFQATTNVGPESHPNQFVLHFYNLHKKNREGFLKRHPLPMIL